MKIHILTYFLIYMCLSVGGWAENVTLKYGYQIDETKLEEILTAKTVEDFLQIVAKNPDLEVMGVYRYFSHVETTLPKAYWEHTSDDAIELIGSDDGQYVRAHTETLNYEKNLILACSNILLSQLQHEYLHYLIDQSAPRSMYSYLDKSFVHPHNMRTVALKHANDHQMSTEYYFKMMARATDVLNANYEISREEIAIESFLLSQSERLKFSEARKYQSANYMKNIIAYMKEDLSLKADLLYEYDGIQQTNYKTHRMRDVLHEKIQLYTTFIRETEDDLRDILLKYDWHVGDLNFDGIVNDEDRNRLEAVIEEPLNISNIEFPCFDITEDGEISNEDLELYDKLIFHR